MKARILPILAWMVIFGVAALLITDIVLITFVTLVLHFNEPAHPISDTATFWMIRIFFWFSVLAALSFGLRGALPGTQALLKPSATKTSTQLIALPTGKQAKFYLTAVNAAGESVPSQTVEVVVP